jgi:flagellar biosynthesis protein FlhF
MQIKRFEAEDMTEALRMVKREFGDDAVILSAKQIRSGGLFGALRKKQVEITAAKDQPDSSAPAIKRSNSNEAENNSFSGALSKHLATELEDDRVTLSSIPSQRKTQTDQTNEFEAPDGNSPMRTRQPQTASTEQLKRRRQDEVDRIPTDNHGLNRGFAAKPFYVDGDSQKIIALVGRCGAGKSSAVAKMACHCIKKQQVRLGMISLDRFRFGANAMLMRFADMMKLPLAIVYDNNQVQSALRKLADVDVVLIDTPGIGTGDEIVFNDVREMLRIANPDEIHLVVNATVRENVIRSTIEAFAGLGVNRLLPTQCDVDGGREPQLDMLQASPYPTAFYGNGVDLFNDLHAAWENFPMPRPVPQQAPARGQVTPLNRSSRQNPEIAPAHDDRKDSVQFVANRNSEMFHHPGCKSVKLINSANIVVFNSIEEALEARFKPCRACCNISMIRKPADRAVGYQRARAY